MLFGVFAVLVAVVLHFAGAHLSAVDNEGQMLPTVWGKHPVRPSRRIRWLHGCGWLLSIGGALTISDLLWNSRPGISIVITVAIITLVNALPSLIVTLLHNRRQAA